MSAPLTPEEMARYQAQLALPDVGPEGQSRLAQAAVLVVGVGGLGCPVAQYLTAAGVGRLTIVDDDVVELTNLHRQVLFGDADVGRAKVDAGRERLTAMNPDVKIVVHRTRFTASNARELVAGHDLAIDGSDNFATRYVLNDACALEAVPLVSGSLYRYEGQVAVFAPPATGCYRCVFPTSPPAEPPCRDTGVLGGLAGIVGTAMAVAATQRLMHGESPLDGRMLLVDVAAMHFRHVNLRARSDCPLCGKDPSITAPTAVAVARCG